MNTEAVGLELQAMRIELEALKDAARAMGKASLVEGWQVNTIVAQNGNVLAHDLCPDHAGKPIAVGDP